jgi:pyruvate/2-oxoglutarate dehydrogenase complex dihydrolipoamide acyltransferase (E2) component
MCAAVGKENAIVTVVKVPKTGGMNTSKVCVVRWLKRVGETVEQGEAVVELETEKVSYELDSPVAGVLLRILAQESAEVPIGDPICHIGQPGEAAPED